MTTIEHKNAVYAYYFYRLIQRAENITLLYNTSSDGLNFRTHEQLLGYGDSCIVSDAAESGYLRQARP